MTQVTLRPAETDDLAFVTNCAGSAYSLYIERIGKKPAPMVADFAAAQREGHLEIMQAEKVDIGFLVSFSRQDSLFVENIAIAPEHQGKGFGGAIFALLEVRAQELGLATIELYTNEKMTENLTLYPRLGFEEFDRRTEAGFNRVYFRKTVD